MNLYHLFYLYLLAILLAFVEVQVEGSCGWASQLPCWRPSAGSRVSRIYQKVAAGKELTGYHIGIFLFVFFILHYPFVQAGYWNPDAEWQTLSIFFLFVVVWDFLWFVINPHFGIHKFHAGCINWHKIWFLGIPIDYYAGVFLSFVCYSLQTVGVYTDWFLMFGFFALVTLLTVITAEIIKKYKSVV